MRLWWRANLWLATQKDPSASVLASIFSYFVLKSTHLNLNMYFYICMSTCFGHLRLLLFFEELILKSWYFLMSKDKTLRFKWVDFNTKQENIWRQDRCTWIFLRRKPQICTSPKPHIFANRLLQTCPSKDDIGIQT